MAEMSKELLRKYVNEQNFTNANEVLDALKGLFRDVLQEALEAELDETLGYGKNDVSAKSPKINNSRNGYWGRERNLCKSNAKKIYLP